MGGQEWGIDHLQIPSSVHLFLCCPCCGAWLAKGQKDQGAGNREAGDFNNCRCNPQAVPRRQPAATMLQTWLAGNLLYASEDCANHTCAAVHAEAVVLTLAKWRHDVWLVWCRVGSQLVSLFPRHHPPVVVGAADCEPPGLPPGVLKLSTASCSSPAHATCSHHCTIPREQA